jgi:hypothetical protein
MIGQSRVKNIDTVIIIGIIGGSGDDQSLHSEIDVRGRCRARGCKLKARRWLRGVTRQPIGGREREARAGNAKVRARGRIRRGWSLMKKSRQPRG